MRRIVALRHALSLTVSAGLIAAGFLGLAAAPARAASPDPFDLQTPWVFVAQSVTAANYAVGSPERQIVAACPGGSGSQLYRAIQVFDAATGTMSVQFTTIGPPSCVHYNAIGFNTNDGYVYGISTSNTGGIGYDHLVRVDSGGVVTDLGAVNLPLDPNNGPTTRYTYNVGSFAWVPDARSSTPCPDNPGQMCSYAFVVTTGSNPAGNGNQPKPMCAIVFPPGYDSNTGQPPLQTSCTTTSIDNVADWVQAFGYLWTFNTNSANPNSPSLDRLAPSIDAAGKFTAPLTRYKLGGNWGKAGQGAGSFGAQWVYGNGNIGLSDNDQGWVYQVELTAADGSPYVDGTPTITIIGQRIKGPSSNGNDGTSAPGAPVDMGVTKTIVATTGVTPDRGFNPGATLTYELKVYNNGWGDSSGFMLDDMIPNPGGSTTIDPATGAPTGVVVTPDNSNVICGFPAKDGNLHCVGGTSTPSLDPVVTITVTVPTPTDAATCLTNTADVLGNEMEPLRTADASDPSYHILTPAFLPNTASVQICPTLLHLTKAVATGATDPVTGDPVYDHVGQLLTYTFTVSNSGTTADQDLVNVNIADTGVLGVTATQCTVDQTGVTYPNGSIPLAHGQSATCDAAIDPAGNYTWEVVQADLDAGAVTNTAHATGSPASDPGSTLKAEADAKATATAVQEPMLSITKVASTTTVAKAGDVVTYTFLVSNPGNVTLTNVTITDSGVAGGTGTLTPAKGTVLVCKATLAAGAVDVPCDATATVTYTVSQADIDAMAPLVNAAIGSAKDTNGGDVPAAEKTATVTPAPIPELTIKKSADRLTLVKDQVITYSFEVTNGPVKLTNVAVVDPPVSFSGAGTLGPVTCPKTTLGAYEKMICRAQYTVQQADVDAGTLTNTAKATGVPPQAPGVPGGAPILSDPSPYALPGDAKPSLAIEKRADKTDLVLGETVTYSYTLTNTGPLTLHGIVVTDDPASFTGVGTLSPIDCGGLTDLAPLASHVCTATYVVQQADVNAKVLVNTASATGLAPDNTSVPSGPATARITRVAPPSLTLTKTADPATVTKAGDVVTFHFTVSNTGPVPLTNVMITDAGVTGGEAAVAPATPVLCVATLDVGAKDVPCQGTFTYKTTQTDIDKGATLVNTATATGKEPLGATVNSAPATVPIAVVPVKGITLDKTADTKDLVLGQIVTYFFTVKNAGTVTLSGVKINETKFTGAGSLAYQAGCPAGSLAPGATVICTAKYTVQQADVDAGVLINDATASGVAPPPPGRTTGDTVVSPVAEAKLPSTPLPSLGLVKTADKQSLVVGETVTFWFTVTNTGNVTVKDITIVEGTFSGSNTLSPIDCGGPLTLTPAQYHTCSATYVVSQGDADVGALNNTATAKGTAPDNSPVVSDPGIAVVPRTAPPSLSIAKKADVTSAKAGDTITYSFLVTNTGQASLSNVKIGETAFTGTGTMSAVTCPTTGLVAGQAMTCTATYVVKAEDVAAGSSLTNTAVASAIDPQGKPVTSEASSALVALVAPPAPPAVVVPAGGAVGPQDAGIMGVLVGTLGLLGTVLAWGGRVVRRREDA